MTALPGATCNTPIVRGRGNNDETESLHYNQQNGRTTLFHEFYVTDQQMVGAAFPKLDTMRWSAYPSAFM
jgi:hypothetical protein